MPLPRSQHCRGWSFQPQRHLTTSAENPPPSKAICEWITSVSNHLLHRCGKYSSRTRHAASALSWTPSNTIWRLALSSRPLTTTSGGPWNSLSFNFFANDGSTPVAFGDLFILDQEYLGTPAALSSSTAGFLAQSTGISSNGYQFDSSITLNSSTQYFFFNGGTQGGDVGFQSPGTLVQEIEVEPPDRPAREMQRESEFQETVYYIRDLIAKLDEDGKRQNVPD